ncbi:competence/damage-inducible protein A [Salinilacihabitans rarus]|uniref:competence/damage-inducible protein A n=1 Tax=Salinilacihabitans rarus TaxID=2961596 RepID=UPI0020C8DCDA|nr:competence/damage-inducible protein A [Salinilacihabitans rarus]
MDVAIVTVGDELLAGETTNTNASWLAARIAERGGTVRRILTIPDDRDLIAETVREWRAAFDAVIVTGGLGATPDDVTVEAVAAALDRDLEVRPAVRDRLEEKAARLREERPELFADHDLELDLDRGATLPAGARALLTESGWAPGCVVENVYVFAGFPDEMREMFDRVSEAFAGDVVSKSLLTATPEGALGAVLAGAPERFDVSLGSYPTKGDAPGRIRVSGTDEAEVDAALAWIRERVTPADEAERPEEGDATGE